VREALADSRNSGSGASKGPRNPQIIPQLPCWPDNGGSWLSNGAALRWKLIDQIILHDVASTMFVAHYASDSMGGLV
jgi:hypothetical protein